MSHSTEQHVVWDVYDELRNARLNVKYHGARLQWTQRANLTMEVLIAVTASSSAIAVWSLWDLPGWREVWKGLAAGAAVLALLKPFLRLPEALRRREELMVGYRVLDHDLRLLCISIRESGSYSGPQQDEFHAVLERKRALVLQERESRPIRWLLRECHKEVLQELPVESFFIPTGE